MAGMPYPPTKTPTDCTDAHRLGGYGIPAIPTQPQNYLPTEFTEHRNDWRRRKNLCTSVQSVGGYSPPEASVYSVQSVGEYPPPEASVYSVKYVGEYPPPEISVNSVNSVGGLAQTNLEWVLWKEFGGLRGYGRDAIPT